MSALTSRRVTYTRADSLPDERARKSQVGLWISWLAFAVVMIFIINVLFNNPNIDLPTIGLYLISRVVLEGVAGTVALSVVSMIVAVVIGVIVGYARISSNVVARVASWIFVWVFRSVPLIVLVLVFGNFALFMPDLGVMVPFTHLMFGSVPTNQVLVPMVAGAIALSLEQGAYLGEIVRSGIQAVPDSQRQAAASLGLSNWEIQRRVVLPQAIPIMLPPIGNSFIILLKSTSLVSVIAGTEVLGRIEALAAARPTHTMDFYFVASVWYLALTTLTSLGQRYVERRFSAYRRRVQGPQASNTAAAEAVTPSAGGI